MALINLGKGLGHFINLELLPDNAVIIDAGVCRGKFIEKLKSLKDTEKYNIIGLEACKTNYDALKFDSCEILQTALVGENFPKQLMFYEFIGLPEWGNVTGINTDTGHHKLKNIVKYNVNTITLQKLINMYELEKIDYLKLDVEGTETEIVNTLNEDTAEKIIQISMEIHNADSGQLSNKLETLGFTIHYELGELYGVRK